MEKSRNPGYTVDYSQDISRSMAIGEVGTLGLFSAQQTNLQTQY
jgi:hypothetical protein